MCGRRKFSTLLLACCEINPKALRACLKSTPPLNLRWGECIEELYGDADVRAYPACLYLSLPLRPAEISEENSLWAVRFTDGSFRRADGHAYAKSESQDFFQFLPLQKISPPLNFSFALRPMGRKTSNVQEFSTKTTLLICLFKAFS